MIALLTSSGLAPGTLVDGWRVVALLGSGGFGAVHKVEKNGRFYALKLALLPEGAGDEKQTHARTRRELMCLLLLDHPNIARVLAYGQWPDEDGGHLYLILEFIEGWTLAEWIERMHPTAQELIRVFAKLASALAHMHGRGVFHRDLKLINVLIRKADGEPIIIDFGAGWFAQAVGVTDAGPPPGTERYRSPEANRFWYANKHNRAARYDYKVADELFAFGVMLHDALTDPRPTEDRQRTALNSILLPQRAPEARNPRIPAALAGLVRRLVAKNPAQRPEDAEAVHRELLELVEHPGAEYRTPVHPPSAQVREPQEAAPGKALATGVLAWVRRRVRRRVAGVGAAAAVALAAMAAFVLGRHREPVPQQQEALPARKVEAPPPSPSPPPGRESPPPALVPLPPESSSAASVSTQKRGPTMKPSKSPPPPPAPQLKPPPFATPEELLKWCKAVGLGTAVALSYGCPGVQVKPEPGDCPEAAVKWMKAHEIDDTGGTFTITFGGREDDPESWPLLRSGRVEATVMYSTYGFKGAVLSGQLWATPGLYVVNSRLSQTGDPKDEAVFMRFDHARLPNGDEGPVCVIPYVGEPQTGWANPNGRPEPGAVRFKPKRPKTVAVYRWP